MNEEKTYPLSEDFTELQGEGIYQGCVMHFIRLAGCNIGKPYPKEVYNAPPCSCSNYHQHSPTCAISEWRRNTQLPIYTEKCTLYDGREFPCDTDYRVKERLTVKQIVARVPENVHRVCITGGEPCMHDLSFLLTGLISKGKFIHIETSGTKLFTSEPIWVTVSPKKNYLSEMIDRANELKLLVDEDFTPETFIQVAVKKPVFLHPVNFEHTVNVENLKLCRSWQKKYPCFRLGVQLHKAISMLVKEHVR